MVVSRGLPNMAGSVTFYFCIAVLSAFSIPYLPTGELVLVAIGGVLLSYLCIFQSLTPLFRTEHGTLIYYGAWFNVMDYFVLDEIKLIKLHAKSHPSSVARLLTIDADYTIHRIWLPALFDGPIAQIGKSLGEEFGARFQDLAPPRAEPIGSYRV